MKVTIAIDPGAAGGIAYCLGSSTVSVTAFPMPDTDGEILNLLRDVVSVANGEPVRVVMEEAFGYAGEGQPGSAMFGYGSRYGFLRGVVMTLGCRLELVRPQSWQRCLGLGMSGRTRAPKGASAEERKRIQQQNGRLKTEWKNKLKSRAQELYPKLNVTLRTSDALLILEFARKMQPPF